MFKLGETTDLVHQEKRLLWVTNINLFLGKAIVVETDGADQYFYQDIHFEKFSIFKKMYKSNRDRLQILLQ